MIEIPLTRGYVALVDDEDAGLSGLKWSADVSRGTVYAIRRSYTADGRVTTERLHRVVVHAKSGDHVDHVNGNGLDNRRSNLRVATYRQNAENQGRRKGNTSGFKGVSRDARNPNMPWVARLRSGNGRRIHVGSYASPEDAARAYDRAAAIHHGPFARLNFPVVQP